MEHRAEREKQPLRKRISDVEHVLYNGYGARIKLLERMQWWQIGLLVGLIAAFTVGVWAVYRENQEYKEVKALIIQHMTLAPAASP